MRSLEVECWRQRLIRIVCSNNVLGRAWWRVSDYIVSNNLEVILFASDDAVGNCEDLSVESASTNLGVADSSLSCVPENVVANYG